MSQSNLPTKRSDIFMPEYWIDNIQNGVTAGEMDAAFLKNPIGQGTETIPNLNITDTSDLGTTTASTITSTGTITAPTFVGNLVLTQRDTNDFLFQPTLTLQKQSIQYSSNTDISGSNVSGITNNQIYTFGKSIPPVLVAVGESTTTVAYSTDNGLSWIGFGTSVFGTSGNCVCWNGSIFVIGGDGGGTSSIAWSYDGMSWNVIDNKILGTTRGIGWDGTKFVAVGTGSSYSIMYSYDSINWIGCYNNFTFGTGVCWNGIIWVATGEGSTNTMAYSYDGITWTGLGLIFADTGFCVAWDGQKFLAGGTGVSTTTCLYYSYDGITWASVTSVVPLQVRGLAWNGKVWVQVGFDNPSIAYSYNGFNWIAATSPFLSGSGYGQTVCWTGTKFIAGGVGNNTMAWSYNGINWIGLGLIFSTFGNGVGANSTRENTITYQTPRTIAVGITPSNINYLVEGTRSWIPITSNPFSSTVYCSCSNGVVWVAGGSGTNTLGFSRDSIVWYGLGNSIFSTACYNIIWTGQFFVGVGEGTNALAYSYDGISWVGLGTPSPFVTSLRTIFWTGTRFVAGGTNGIMAYATNANFWRGSWTTISSPFDTIVYYILGNGSTIVSAGQGTTNTLAYSTNDGISWTGLAVFSTAGIGLAWSGTRWVAVGGSAVKKTIHYSSDGISWTGVSGVFSITGDSVVWTGTQFIAGGSSFGTPTVYFSADGITWIAGGNPFGDPYNMYGVSTNTGLGLVNIKQKILLVGKTGAIYYSRDNGINWATTWTGLMPTVRTIINGRNVWVAGGIGSSSVNTLAYSFDGFNWRGLGTTIFSAGATTGCYGITCGNSSTRGFLAAGAGTNTIAYSNDGINWTGVGNVMFQTGFCVAQNTIPAFYYVAVAGGGGVGTANTLAYSANGGLNWAGLGKTIFSTACYSILPGAIFIACGEGTNTLAYSQNIAGTSWTGLGTTIFSLAGYTIVQNNVIIVAGGIGSTNTLAYSYNGITWTGLGKTIFSTACYSIAWNGDFFYAIGNGTTNNSAYSYDGITWVGLGTSSLINNGNTVFSGIGTSPDNILTLTNPNTKLDVVTSTYYSDDYTNTSVSITNS